jgi:hypothetical protein
MSVFLLESRALLLSSLLFTSLSSLLFYSLYSFLHFSSSFLQKDNPARNIIFPSACREVKRQIALGISSFRDTFKETDKNIADIT